MNSSFYLFICVLKYFVFVSILSAAMQQKRDKVDTLLMTDKHFDLNAAIWSNSSVVSSSVIFRGETQ